MRYVFRTGRLAAWVVFLTAASAAMAQNTAAASKTNPVTINAGADWVPLKLELDLEPGSALDFSTQPWQEAPAGKRGRVMARSDGQFAFAKDPRTPRRFYGINLCFGALYISHEEADRLADRLQRLGYNAVRVHHYERGLTQGQPLSTQLNPKSIDQLDYLLAALKKRGLYYTTDLFVSRGVPWNEIGVSRAGEVPMNTFKVLVPVHDGAWNNWKQFTRALLTHLNPYNDQRYADDPALAWLSMINEGNFGNYLKEIQSIPEWKTAWNEWLLNRYKDRAALAAAWKEELKPDENPADGSVALPDSIYGKGLRPRDCLLFFAAKEREMIVRMKRFLREDLRCDALITDANAWTNFTIDQESRLLFDYVDDHFYIDHPEFIERPWRLPSRSANTSPILGAAAGGRAHAFTRLYDKPFTITEYNYSGPGRFRGVGGILTGALGALQGWGGIWRFAYSHNREAMFQPSRMGYFDMAGDPLSQAAERASLCLFLRGDLQMAPHSLAVVMTPEDLSQPPDRLPRLAPNWHWAAWVTRLGMQVVTNRAPAPKHAAVLPLGWKSGALAYPGANVAQLNPYTTGDRELMAMLKENRVLAPNNVTDPAKSILMSETGEVLLDAARNILVLDTTKTAGGYAPAGETIEARRAGVKITLRGSDATLWVSSLDDRPIARSRRLLVTHLTDLQNTGIQYAEEARKTLLEWGRLPHLARNGQAAVRIQLRQPGQYKVWALSASGRRRGEIPVKTAGAQLEFTADVGASPADGARFLYEIARK